MSIRLTTDLRLLSEFSAVNCAPGGGRTERIAVPFHHAEITLPRSDLDGIIITGDLQFYDRNDVPKEDRKLMGFVVADEISALCEAGLLPDAKRIGVILVGDLYADPCLLKRGGSGDVDDIWREFADHFRWVVGVSGNHDLFEGKDAFPNSFQKISNIHALDKTTVNLDGLRFGGISGILGNPRKIWRYTDSEFWDASKRILKSPLDCLILHQGPIGSKRGMRGAGMINEAIRYASYQPGLVTFGHCYWPEPVDSQEGIDLLNADARVFFLTRSGIEIDL